MNTGLDLTISFIIGGVLILMLLNMNTRITNEANTAFLETMPVTAANQLKSIVEYDIPKMGAGLPIPSRAIIIADSLRLRFALDTSRGTTVYDSCVIDWRVEKPVYNTSTFVFPNGMSIRDSLPNPREIFVYRSIEKGGVVTRRNAGIGVTEFRFDYYDNRDTLLPSPVADPTQIKLIKVTFKTESRWRIKGTSDTTTTPSLSPNAYPGQMFIKLYRPRNIM
jgi:hypothetical protein